MALLAFWRLMHSDDAVTPSKDFTSLPKREARRAFGGGIFCTDSKMTRARAAAVDASRRYWKGASLELQAIQDQMPTYVSTYPCSDHVLLLGTNSNTYKGYVKRKMYRYLRLRGFLILVL